MKTILIDSVSNSLGDTIGLMPCVEHFINKTQDQILLKIPTNFHKLFTRSYPNIKFYQEGMSYDKSLKLIYDFNKPLQTGYANQLGFFDWNYVRPKIDSFKKDRPIKNKYITINLHSTSQLKYWNHPSGIDKQSDSPYWNELCGMIRKNGYTPVVLERDETFGVPPFRNGLPKKAQKKIGLPLEDVLNYIEHSEFFIGLSSGPAWIAHALGKPVCMISNFSEDWNEFDLSISDYKRIINKSVCHGCWNQVNKEFKFDPSDWYWCPRHKNTERQFECHTSITAEMVFNEIKNWMI